MEIYRSFSISLILYWVIEWVQTIWSLPPRTTYLNDLSILLLSTSLWYYNFWKYELKSNRRNQKSTKREVTIIHRKDITVKRWVLKEVPSFTRTVHQVGTRKNHNLLSQSSISFPEVSKTTIKITNDLKVLRFIAFLVT